MRLPVRSQSIRNSPAIAVILVLAGFSVVGLPILVRSASGAAGAGPIERLRVAAEPAIFEGGIIVSRHRHVIAGSVMGCGSGAALGAGAGAALGLATGGAGLASVLPAAGIGCVVGAVAGIATAYPLDHWAFDLD